MTDMPDTPEERSGRFLFQAAFLAGCLALPALVYAPLTFMIGSTPVLGIPTAAALVVTAILAGIFASRGHDRKEAAVIIALCVYCFLLFTERSHPFLFRTQWLAMLPIGLAVALFVLRRRPTSLGPLLLALSGVSIATALVGFGAEGDGSLIFSDDFPPLLYRLEQLKASFPAVPFYNPLWNAGVEAREFLPSGALNLFLLWYPLIRFSELTCTFTFLVASTLFILIPVLQAVAVRVAGGSSFAQCLASLFALINSLVFYRWGLAYGTLPFLLSISLIPLIVALLAVPNEKRTPWWVIAIVIATTLSCFWSPSVLLLAPIFAFVLLFRNGFRSTPFLIASALLVLLNLPWMTLFVITSRVDQFVSLQSAATDPTLPATHGAHFKSPLMERIGAVRGSLAMLRDMARTFHPILLTLAFPALWFLARRDHRLLLGAAVAMSAMLATFGPVVKPQLELGRFWLTTLLLVITPIALLCENYLQTSWKSLLPKAGLLSVLFVSPFWIWGVVRNQSSEHFTFARPIVPELVNAIQKHHGGGRVLFAGFILHEFSGGHVAPLARWTHRPLMASRYQHDRWTYTDIMPESYRNRGDSGVEEFLDIYNVSAIITHDRFWSRWFRKRSDRYKLLWEKGKFRMFTRLSAPNSYFHSGKGTILSQDEGHVRFTVADDEVVLRFHYVDSLTVPGCEILPERLEPSVVLVRLKGCPKERPLELRMVGPVERLRSRFYSRSGTSAG